MTVTRQRLTVLVATVAILVGSLVAPAVPAEAQAAEDYRILVFSKTAGFRHDSIPAGIQAIQDLAAANNVAVDATEDATAFTEANLDQYAAVVFLSTTGDVLDANQQAAFESYIQSGGGFAGIHAASDTEYDWAWYGDLVGAYFAGHPANQTATVVTEDHAHPSTDHLPTEWSRFDEWYSFQSNPRTDVHVLQSLDETTYDPSGNEMGPDHPISWCHDYAGGRSWYTALGHTTDSFSEPDFLELIWGGIETAAGVAPGDCGATVPDNFQKVSLDDNTSNPMELDVAADGRVFYIDRNGDVRIIRPDGSITTAGSLDVYTGQEYGLTGMELDPDFATNNWIYLTYSPDDGTPHDVVSRFTMDGDTLDLSSETLVIDIPTQRDECCHAGGEIEFDPAGDLYVALGDNTNPFASDGYAPIDERPGRELWDAQRTSANTNVLNGKVLRITPLDAGGYDIPEGNLFDEAADTEDLTRPEIYAMGFRNPFRIGFDPLTGTLLVADYGPDAGSPDPDRGPAGRVEWNIVDQPGNYGWPYCVSDNEPYIDYDFATGTSGAAFDCAGGPTNDSPNNTGLTQLPPAIGAEVWYGNAATGAPTIGNGGAPMAGDVYRHDDTIDAEGQWPEYWDGKAIFGEWNRTTNGMFSFQVDDDVADVSKINQLFPGDTFRRLMAFDWGPDGALYFIEWGSGFGGDNADSGVYRLEYVGSDRSPIARLDADVTSGPTPLTVQFSGDGSFDPDGGPVTHAWDFDGDGTTDSTEPAPEHTFTDAGDYEVQLIVTDDEGDTGSAGVTITAGNTAPTIEVVGPTNGGFFSFGDTIAYELNVTDPEDGTVDCAQVVTQPGLGHDEHSHGYDQYPGCTGEFPLPGDEGHVGANIFGVVTFTYTDTGGDNGAGSLTTQEVVELRLRHTEAEHFAATGRTADGVGGGDPGVQTEDTSDVGGGQNIGFIEDGDWWSLDPADLVGIESVDFRVASAGAGGEVEIHTDAPDGPVVGTATVPVTGGWQSWTTVTADLPDGVTSDSLYFVANSPTDSTGGLFNVNWMEFDGPGVSANRAPEVEVSATPTEGDAPLPVDFLATATDPEGDSPLTYEWTFGDGGTATGAEVSHTYETGGDYTAEVTVTDPAGASASAAVQIAVDSADAGRCLAGRSDDFLGTSLDTARWSVIRENQQLRVEDSDLVIPVSATDIYGTNNTDTPNIVVQPLPDGAATITTLVELEAYQAYEQAGLMLYQDDDNYMKFVLEGRDTGSVNPDARVFQFVEEIAGSPTETNTSNLGASYPDEVYLQLRIDTAGTVEGFYSTDGSDWTGMGVTGDVSGYADPQMGLFALSGNGQPEDEEAHFDWFHVTPDDSAGDVAPDDQFDGTSLDLCRWSDSVRLNPDLYTVEGGELTVQTGDGDIYTSPNAEVPNFFLQPQPGEDWTVETKLDTSALAEQYQQGGLMIWADDDNYVKFDHVVDNAAGSPVSGRLELRSEVGGSIVNPQPGVAGLDPQSELWLRLARSGTTFSAEYSLDGENWTALSESVDNALAASDGSVGIFTIGTNQAAPVPVSFDYFDVLDDDVEPLSLEVAVEPAEPDGANGWYVSPVTVTGTASDETATVEFNLDGSGWAADADGQLIVDGDGSRTVEVRAVRGDETTEVQEVSFDLDATAPVVTVDGVADGEEVGNAGSMTVEASDATSGLADVAIRLDGAVVGSEVPLEVALAELRLGEHTLVVDATDVAGNTTTETIEFDTTTSFVDIATLVDRYEADGSISTELADDLRRDLDKARQMADRGKAKQARQWISRAIDTAVGLTDDTARDVLVRSLTDLYQQM